MKFKSSLPFSAAIFAAFTAVSLSAQTVPDESQPEALLNIPSAGQTLFGSSDPNMRRATAKVNGEVITGTDVDQRLALIVFANGGKLPQEEVARFRTQILSNLIDETLQMQEAQQQEIGVSQNEVDEYFKSVAQQNYKRSPEDTNTFLKSFGSSAASVKRQIRGELSWNRLLRRNIEPFVNVSAEEVNSIIERINAAKGTREFHLGEIYLSATPENERQVLSNAERILEQLRQGGSFVAYARQFSEASSAAVGGDLGWLKAEQLPASLAQAATSMNENQVVVVPSPGGISILALLDSREVATADPRDTKLSLKQLAITFPEGTSEEAALPRVEAFNKAVAGINGCGSADTVAQQLGAEIVSRDGIVIRSLPGPLQQVMLNLQVGQSSPPYGSLKEGVRAFVVCGRDAPQVAGTQSFERIMQSLESERVDRRARLYLRDLRRDAIIEYN